MTTLAFQPIAVPRGETIRWTGAPPTGFRLRPSDAFVVPFSLLWASFAFAWEAAVITSGAPLFARLWGIPFVCVGLYITVGRFVVDAFARAHTRYAITDEAAYIETTWPRYALRRFGASQLDALRLERSGSGDGGALHLGNDGDGWSRSQRRALSDEATINAIVLTRGIDDAYQKLLDVAAR
jgi:hypothetical protein